MLDNIRCEDYGFKVSDMTVAAMVKSYLRWMSHEELARLIDDAKTAAMTNAVGWQAQGGEQLLKSVILYLRNESFPIIKGEKYVEELPEEFAAFITDCWNDMQA